MLTIQAVTFLVFVLVCVCVCLPVCVCVSVCVCVHPDSKLRVLARHVPCAVVEAGGHPYHLSWMPNEEGSG